jgi:aryl-alcohol dehydrogenase-like predicted oxidoreductase
MISRRAILEGAGKLSLLAAVGPAASYAQAPLMRRPIPTTGERLPVIGLGTYRTFDVGDDPAVRAPLVEVTRRFFAEGGTLVDSSARYGRSEAVLGDVLRRIGRPDDLFAATKVSADGRDAGIRQMQASREKMGVEQIDLMQVHNLRDWRTQLPVLKAWKAEGTFRYIGISASREALYDEFLAVMRGEPLDFVQINYSVAERKSEERILPLATDRGMAVLVNRPFVAGALFGRVAGKPLPEWAAQFDCTSWAQFFLKFVLAHPAVTCAIQATSDPEHLVDNMRAGRGRLPDEAARRRMVRLIGVSGRPPWD